MTLLEKLEAATGPDRELDAEIACFSGLYKRDKSRPNMLLKVGTSHSVGGWPAYSASIDAAMTLVPEGWTYEGRQGPSGFPHLWSLSTIASGDVRYTTVEGRAPTPALAICIAAIKAKGIEG